MSGLHPVAIVVLILVAVVYAFALSRLFPVLQGDRGEFGAVVWGRRRSGDRVLFETASPEMVPAGPGAFTHFGNHQYATCVRVREVLNGCNENGRTLYRKEWTVFGMDVTAGPTP